MSTEDLPIKEQPGDLRLSLQVDCAGRDELTLLRMSWSDVGIGAALAHFGDFGDIHGRPAPIGTRLFEVSDQDREFILRAHDFGPAEELLMLDAEQAFKYCNAEKPAIVWRHPLVMWEDYGNTHLSAVFLPQWWKRTEELFEYAKARFAEYAEADRKRNE